MINTKELSNRQILEERARRLAQIPEQEDNQGEILQLTAFHNGSEFIGVPTSLVFETQPLCAHHWARVPNTPAFIVGIINLRGHIFSIMDLACFLGLPSHPIPEKAHILLVRGGTCADGKIMELTLLCDDVPQICVVPVDNLYPAPSSSTNQEFIHGATRDMLMVIDLEHLLSDIRLIVKDED